MVLVLLVQIVHITAQDVINTVQVTLAVLHVTWGTTWIRVLLYVVKVVQVYVLIALL